MPELSVDRFELDPDLILELSRTGGLTNSIRQSLSEPLDAVRRSFDEGKGAAILTGVVAADEKVTHFAFQQICAAFGELMAQDGSGTIVREVKDRGTALGEGRGGRYADTRSGGNLHTDGAEAPLPVPASFALQCVRPARSGGALVLVSLDEVLERLDPSALKVLRHPFHFDRRGDERDGEAPTTVKPVLFEDEDGRICVTYLRRYIEVGHSRPEVQDLTDEQIAALDAFDTLLGDQSLVMEDRLAAGELALIDNKRTLHGRTEFVDHPEPSRHRLLYRAWIKRI
jgi:alpha-ketoglutarate-dependent taurine dioxygenase